MADYKKKGRKRGLIKSSITVSDRMNFSRYQNRKYRLKGSRAMRANLRRKNRKDYLNLGRDYKTGRFLKNNKIRRY